MKKDSLSDKRGVINIDENGKEMWAYHEKDVQEAVQRIIKRIRSGVSCPKGRDCEICETFLHCIAIIEEEMGEDLIWKLN